MAVATQLTGTYEADPVHSSIVFGVRHIQVSNFRASFDGFEARLYPTRSGVRLEGAVRTDSISIREPAEFREHVVRGADFFDGDNHPEIRFKSTHVELGEDGHATITGDLTMKGISRGIAASGVCQPPVEDPFGARRAALELHATVDRRDWGLDWQLPLPSGGDALGWNVDVTVHLGLVQHE